MDMNFSYARDCKFLRYRIKATSATNNKYYKNHIDNNQHHKYQNIHDNKLNHIYFSRY